MKKIASLFCRNYETDRLVRDEIVSGSEWVVNGEGVATRKLDGTAAMVKDGQLFKRYDAKKGKTPPRGFVPAQDPDLVTGHYPGWLPVDPLAPSDRWFIEAQTTDGQLPDGTYELLGPKINGNPEKFSRHTLVRHGNEQLPNAPRTFEALREYLRSKDIEGIVWHHTDGRMVKIKTKDFGFRRKPAKQEPGDD